MAKDIKPKNDISNPIVKTQAQVNDGHHCLRCGKFVKEPKDIKRPYCDYCQGVVPN